MNGLISTMVIASTSYDSSEPFIHFHSPVHQASFSNCEIGKPLRLCRDYTILLARGICAHLQVLEQVCDASKKGTVGETQQMMALGTARALVRHHMEDILPNLRQLVLGAVSAVDDQRMSVAKAAICLFKVGQVQCSTVPQRSLPGLDLPIKIDAHCHLSAKHGACLFCRSAGLECDSSLSKLAWHALRTHENFTLSGKNLKRRTKEDGSFQYCLETKGFGPSLL